MWIFASRCLFMKYYSILLLVARVWHTYQIDMADYRFPGEWVKDNMVLEPSITDETINQVESLEMTEDDILIASYPKTGTISSAHVYSIILITR